MVLFRTKHYDLFVSDDLAMEAVAAINPPLQSIEGIVIPRIESWLQEELFTEYRQFIRLHYELRGARVAIVEARGSYKQDEWLMHDGEERTVSVQKWITAYEERYDYVILRVCNPSACRPESKKATLLVADQTNDIHGPTTPIMCLLHPERGELSPFDLEEELRQVQAELAP